MEEATVGPRIAEPTPDDAVIRTTAARVHEARVRADEAFALWTAIAHSDNAAAEAAWVRYAAAVAGVRFCVAKSASWRLSTTIQHAAAPNLANPRLFGKPRSFLTEG